MAKWPRFDPDADRRLAKALGEGGEESLVALYDIYAERLRDYCGSLVRDQRTATDIVHDTLIDASRRVRRMRDRTRLRAWLYAGVRRRCLQRVRHPVLRWDHGNGDALAALLGIPARRAATRIARAESRAEAAVSTAQLALARRCATVDRAGTNTEAGPDSQTADRTEPREPVVRAASVRETTTREPAEPARPLPDAALAEHVADCADCLRRGDVSLATLLDLIPAPTLPASLRHRVIHTGTDPELAGYRADIAARGGTLNAAGLPRQPDIPSYFARRWLFTGGGMVGALVTAVIPAFLIGPGAPLPDLIWPSIG